MNTIIKEEIMKFIKEAIRRNSNQTIEEIDISKDLYVYIASSIEFIKLIVEIEEQYGISFSNEELAEKTQYSVEKLIQDVYEKTV